MIFLDNNESMQRLAKLLPPECTGFSVEIALEGILRVTYHCLAPTELLEALAEIARSTNQHGTTRATAQADCGTESPG